MYLSIREQIHPGHWLPSEGKVKSDKRIPRHEAINRKIINTRRAFYRVIEGIEKNNLVVSASRVKEKLELELNFRKEEPVKEGMGLFEYFDFFIERMKNDREEDTHRYFVTARDRLKGFDKNLEWRDINEKTYRRYIQYLEGEGLSKNYIGTLINRTRIVANRAWQDDVQNLSDHKKWGKIHELTDTTYLTIDEIQKLYDLELNIEALDQARDIFIIGCWTGLRSVNYLSIDPKKDISPDGKKLRVLPAKGGEKVLHIPLHWMVREIFKKYNYVLPKINYHALLPKIKMVAEAAGLDDTFKTKRTQGGRLKDFEMCGHKAITTHTATRSFATNMYKLGVPVKIIMDITGHTQVSTFMRYIRKDREESADFLANHPEFEKPEAKKD